MGDSLDDDLPYWEDSKLSENPVCADFEEGSGNDDSDGAENTPVDQTLQQPPEMKSKKQMKFQVMKEKRKAFKCDTKTEVQVPTPVNLFGTFIEGFSPDHIIRTAQFDFVEAPSNSLPQGQKKKRDDPFSSMIANLIPSFRKKYCGGGESKRFDHGCVTVVIVCSGARRCTKVINPLSVSFKCKIAKLFAKHFKIQEQVEALSKSYFPVAVGTPNRLNKLLEIGALRLSETMLILLDLALDSKEYSLLTLPEVKEDMAEFLTKYVLPEKEHLRIAFVAP